MTTQLQEIAPPLPRTGHPDLRTQQEKDNRLQYLRSQVAHELEGDSLIHVIVACNAPVYHRLQMLVGMDADRGYRALLKREDCNIVGNGQLLSAICTFVPGLAPAIFSLSYETRAEALERYPVHEDEPKIRMLLQALFAGDLKRGRRSTTQKIYVRCTCAGCLRQVSVSFKQGPMYICKHCLPLWFKTSERYMSQQQLDKIWLGLPTALLDGCVVDTSFDTAAIPITYHTDQIQKLAPQIHQGLSLATLRSGQHDRVQLAINYIQTILSQPPAMKEQEATAVRSGLSKLYCDADALDVFDVASVNSDILQRARSLRFQQNFSVHTLRQLVADGGAFLRKSLMGPEQIRNALGLFEQSVTGQRYCLELMLEWADHLGGITRPDLVDYITGVIQHGIEVGANAEQILSHTNDQVAILLEASVNQTTLNTAKETWNEWLTLLAHQSGPFNQPDPSIPPISSTEMCGILDKLLPIGLAPAATAKLWIHLAVGVRLQGALTSDAWISRGQEMLAANKVVLRTNTADNIPNPGWIDDVNFYSGVGHDLHVVRGPQPLDPRGSTYISPSGDLAVYPITHSNMGME